LGGIY